MCMIVKNEKNDINTSTTTSISDINTGTDIGTDNE